MLQRCALLAGICVMLSGDVSASIFGSITGLIHDPEHRPVQGAKVTIWSNTTKWAAATTSDGAGQFRFDNVSLGTYTVEVNASGFAPQTQQVTLASDGELRLHFPLMIAGAKESVQVTDVASEVNPDSSTSITTISRQQISNTPGASDPNSLAMITNYVPGSYMVHDQLHIRGGHQVSWLLDGVPVPNTSIASNVGPQFDPKDIDTIEVQRGGYSAEYGDRTYGVFNVVTRSGFERNREGEFVANYGSFNQTSDQISFGDHTERFAYYGSLSGYRTDLGLETPVQKVINDQAAGLSAFTSLIFNKDANNQLRLVASARGDHYQVPIDPTVTDILHDVENERDDFVNFSWLHTMGSGVTLTVSPFYHFNRAHYEPSSDDTVQSEYDRGSNYVGGVASIAVIRGAHNFHAGLQVFGERDNQLYEANTVPPGGPDTFPASRTMPWANSQAAFIEEQFKATTWLTFNGGVRLSHYGGPFGVSENSADPRIGAAIQIPHLHWVLRGFYGRYYQAPPLVTVNNPALSQGFLPLHGERDEQREFGLAIPFQGWTFDVSNFRTGARNFFDHDALGNSNVFFPLTLAHARIRGWEAMAKSPTIAGRAQFHLVYSHQYAEWSGEVTGGFVGGDSCDTLCFLDHDQRDTFTTGFHVALPWRSSTDFNLNYGSGFVDGDGPAHLPDHTSFDLALAKSFGENVTLRLTGLNLSNNHYMLDNSNTFGGTHFANPREISAQVTYRFRY